MEDDGSVYIFEIIADGVLANIMMPFESSEGGAQSHAVVIVVVGEVEDVVGEGFGDGGPEGGGVGLSRDFEDGDGDLAAVGVSPEAEASGIEIVDIF